MNFTFESARNKKCAGRRIFNGSLAEAVRFELTDLFRSPVFKTGAIDHSATLPWGEIVAVSAGGQPESAPC